MHNIRVASGNYEFYKDSTMGQPVPQGGSGLYSLPLEESSTSLFYRTTLTAPGQSNSFTVEIENNGTINAKIGSVTLPTLDATSARLMTATCTWQDGTTIKANDTINANAKKTVKCTNTFKTSAELTESDLALFTTSAVTAATSLQMNFVQAD